MAMPMLWFCISGFQNWENRCCFKPLRSSLLLHPRKLIYQENVRIIVMVLQVKLPPNARQQKENLRNSVLCLRFWTRAHWFCVYKEDDYHLSSKCLVSKAKVTTLDPEKKIAGKGVALFPVPSASDAPFCTHEKEV